MIVRGFGSHFDPEIASLFLTLEREGRIVTEAVPGPLYDDVLTTSVFSSSTHLRALS